MSRVESETENSKKYSEEDHLIDHRRMSSDPVTEIYSPGQCSRESVGEVTESGHDRSDSPHEDSEDNTWEK